MVFDNGTWWLVVLLLGFATGALIYLLKRSLFGRVDKLDESVKRLDESTVKKEPYEKEKDKLQRGIERIERDYTPRSVHDKSYDELKSDINTIMQTYLTKDDFIREFSKMDRKIDNRLGNLQSLLGGEGVAEDEFLDSVNFLASEGYIHLRLISTREPALLADHEYTELEAKLTSRGKRLLKGGIEDNMIEV